MFLKRFYILLALTKALFGESQTRLDTVSFNKTLLKVDALLEQQTDSASALIRENLNKALKARYSYGYSRLNYQLARYYMLKGLNDSALLYSPIAIKHARVSKNNDLIVACFLLHARILSTVANYNEALKYCLQAQRFSENTSSVKIKTKVWHDLGLIYSNIGSHEKSLYYFSKGRQLAFESKDTFNYANITARMGGEYNYLNKGDSSLLFNLEGLRYFKLLKHKRGIGATLTNLSATYTALHQYQKAIETSKEALKIREELGDTYAIAILKSNLAQTFLNLGNYQEALKYALAAQEIIDHQEDSNMEISNLSVLKTIYARLNAFDKAYQYSERYLLAKEKHFTNTNLTALNELQTRYEIDKQEREIALLQMNNKRAKEKGEAENHRRNIILGAVIIGLLIISIFAFLLYKRVQQSQLQKGIIEKQKMLVDEKQKEIIDSINYAQTIQNAIMPQETDLLKDVADAFVVFRPKDIVSGDFYWFTKHGSDLFVVVADCTGHGVPGAFMSLMGISYLNEIVNENKVSDTAQILNLLRDKLVATLNKTSRERNNREGMDIAIVHINQQTNAMQFSAANNNLYVLSNDTLIEFKGDKMPVGFHTENANSFTAKHHSLKKGDRLFMITDGLPDQFGGEKGKKFMYKRFEKLATDSAGKTLSQVKILLNQTITDWQGANEQIDDITCLVMEI